MSATFAKIRSLLARRAVRISQHAMVRIVKRGILIRTIVEGIDQAEVIEDYPTYHAGPAVLLLQRDPSGEALHVVWGIETGTEEPAVLVTAYRPNPADWSSDFRSRMK